MSGDLLRALAVLADIRAAVGDPEGKLMQEELVARCRELRERAEAVPVPLLRPTEPGWYWVHRSSAKPTWIVKRAALIPWEVTFLEWEANGPDVLAESAGGEWKRCDMVNTPEDSGDRYFRMEPPQWTPDKKEGE